MNINHVEDPPQIPDDVWKAIWNKQRKLHEKYKPIEERSGIGFALVKDREYNINDATWQYVLKDLAYRVIEEICESLEAQDTNHRLEELIDALHFMVELNLVVGVEKPPEFDCKDVKDPSPLNIIYHLGMAGNCLKQKPWKQNPFETDERKYLHHIYQATLTLIAYLRHSLGEPEIYQVYFKKNKVNQFRQDSNY